MGRQRIRREIIQGIRITQTNDYSRIEELKRNHEENLEFLQEVLNRPVKIRITVNCIVLIQGKELIVPTLIAQKAEYKIERYV